MRKEEILEVLKKKPMSTKELMIILGYNTSDRRKISRFRQKHMKKLEENGLVYRLERSNDNKILLKKRFNIEWGAKSIKRKSKKIVDKVHSYYFNTEKANAVKFKELYNVLINKHDFFDEKDKKKINLKINEIVKMLSKFNFLTEIPIHIDGSGDLISYETSNEKNEKMGARNSNKIHLKIKALKSLMHNSISPNLIEREIYRIWSNKSLFVKRYRKIQNIKRYQGFSSQVKKEKINKVLNKNLFKNTSF